MARKLTQRELRNNSGEVMRALDRGEHFIVTSNGRPVGELHPYKRRQFVPRDVFLAAFEGAPHIDYQEFREDIDRYLDQDPTPVAEAPSGRGLLDTSVVIGIDEVDPSCLPAEISISTPDAG